jgi:hypothetical protein
MADAGSVAGPGRAGHLAAGMAAHPVSDRKQPRSCVDGILVVFAVQADARYSDTGST